MRSTPARATGTLRIVTAAIAIGVVPLLVFLVDQWTIGKVEQAHIETREQVVAVVREEEARARLDRLCLIEALLAVRDALQGDEVPAGLPPSCQQIIAADLGEGAPAP